MVEVPSLEVEQIVSVSDVEEVIAVGEFNAIDSVLKHPELSVTVTV